MKNHVMVKTCFGIAVTISASCGSKDSATTGDQPVTTTATEGGGSTNSNKVALASTIADLKMAGALAITLPEAFAGSARSQGLHLVEGKKSSEACMMGQTMSQATRSLGEVGGFFCHLEIEKDRLKFGKKYRIMTSMGEFARIYVDNSQAATGKLTIGFCQQDKGDGHSGKQLITIDSLSEFGPKGSVLNVGTDSGEGVQANFASATDFDVSAEGIVRVIASQRHEMPEQTFNNHVELELRKSGVSSLKLASRGADSARGGTFYERGAARFDGTKGSALFESKGTYESQPYEFSRRAHFNNAGDVLTSATVDAALQPEASVMSEYLADDFKPAAPSGWVGEGCPDYEEDVTLDPSSAAHNACDQGHDGEYNCWDPNQYEASSENVSVP